MHPKEPQMERKPMIFTPSNSTVSLMEVAISSHPSMDTTLLFQLIPLLARPSSTPLRRPRRMTLLVMTAQESPMQLIKLSPQKRPLSLKMPSQNVVRLKLPSKPMPTASPSPSSPQLTSPRPPVPPPSLPRAFSEPLPSPSEPSTCESTRCLDDLERPIKFPR